MMFSGKATSKCCSTKNAGRKLTRSRAACTEAVRAVPRRVPDASQEIALVGRTRSSHWTDLSHRRIACWIFFLPVYRMFARFRLGGSRGTVVMDSARKRKASNATPNTTEGASGGSKRIKLLVRRYCSFFCHKRAGDMREIRERVRERYMTACA